MTRRARRVPFWVVVLLFTLTAGTALAQGRPQYDEKDKKRLAEISKRPEVVQAIESAWENVRRQDMEFAYRVNTAGSLGDWRSDPQWLEIWSKYGRLYDNPILVNYVNGLGQRLVPKDSSHLYSFRLLLDPTPRAEALSTGSIYVSTGLASLVDNEAQLGYVLAHEIAHIERNHAYESIRGGILEAELDKEREKSAQKKRAWFGLAAALGGAAIGAAAGDSQGAAIGLLAGTVGGPGGGTLLFRNKFEPTKWDVVAENEADAAALDMLLAERFDIREVSKVYTRLAGLVAKDSRVGLGFIGDPTRVKERTGYVESQIDGALKPKVESLKASLVSSSPEFTLLMAALKRDNGIIALDYDLMPMARANLEDAAQLRSNDPRVQYYLGKVYAMTGRTAEDRLKAVTYLQAAIRYDGERGSFPAPHLEYALHLIEQNTPAARQEAQDVLKRYVNLYQREHAGEVPSNMHVIYDYLALTGDQSWYAPPVSMIAPRNNEPLPVAPQAVSAPPPAPPDAMRKPKR